MQIEFKAQSSRIYNACSRSKRPIKPDHSGKVSVFGLIKARAGALKDSGRHLPPLGHKQQARKELSGRSSPALPLGAL